MRDVKDNTGGRMPRTVMTGLVSGVLGGLAVGAMVGPVGAAVGIALGMLAGAAAGLVLGKEAEKRELRSRELDDIIGVTSGDMGAGRVSLVPMEELAEETRRQQWLAEWLTPPPPQAM